MKRKAKPSEPFMKSPFHRKNIKALSLDYGRNNERQAKDRYLEDHPAAQMHDCGSVVH